MKHLIVGNGNLGCSLENCLKISRKNYVKMATKDRGYLFPQNYDHLMLLNSGTLFDYIWYCVGPGGVSGCDKNPSLARTLHINIPTAIAEQCRHSKIIYFSSDYADTSDTTFPTTYAKIKIDAEKRFSEMKNVSVIRVSSLWGTWKKWSCFPGKLIANHWEDDVLTLPPNITTPTNTDWLATMLTTYVEEIVSNKIIHTIAPLEPMNYCEWVRYAFDNAFIIREGTYDLNRPLVSAMDCTFAKINQKCIGQVMASSHLWKKLLGSHKAKKFLENYQKGQTLH